MTLVRFRKYREYENMRIQTNDTVMGILAGSKLAAQTLSLTSGSNVLLGDIFPNIEHIKRFNLTTDKASEILVEAEELLCVLAVPQVLAIHEDLMSSFLELLVSEQKISRSAAKMDKPALHHEKIEIATGCVFNSEAIELFNLLKKARNEHIHNGGRARNGFVNARNSVSQSALAVWKDITKYDFVSYSDGDVVRIGLSELIGILALTKRIAEEGNYMLHNAVSRSTWIDMAIDDWEAEGFSGNPAQKLRKARGWVNLYYRQLNISEKEVSEALIRAEAS